MHVERFEWDEANLTHATRHSVSVSEIEQAVRNATQWLPADEADRRRVRSVTDGGRRITAAVQLLGGGLIRPITAWERKR